MIWTTTPWTLPANQAVALRAEFDYVLRASARDAAARAAAGRWPHELAARRASQRYGTDGTARCSRSSTGTALEGLQLEHPFHDGRCR